jgi:hypothetical protein
LDGCAIVSSNLRLVTAERLMTYCRHHFSGEMLDDLQHFIHMSGALIEH